MPITKIHWTWEEAFQKFGFDDGDGLVFTDVVASVLESDGYEVEYQEYGMHNTVITRIVVVDGDTRTDLLENVDTGYADPRLYLPRNIIDMLDQALPEEGTYDWN